MQPRLNHSPATAAAAAAVAAALQQQQQQQLDGLELDNYG
jgi:hypothetical protein